MSDHFKDPNSKPASGSVLTPVISTYLPHVAGAVTWQAEVKDGRIQNITLSHHHINARFKMADNGRNNFEFTEGGETYRIYFEDGDVD